MSKPTSRCTDKLNGLVTQTVGAMSALCMEPQALGQGLDSLYLKDLATPLRHVDKSHSLYLKDVDKWAAHAYQHLEACMEIIGDLINERRLEYEKARLRMMED